MHRNIIIDIKTNPMNNFSKSLNSSYEKEVNFMTGLFFIINNAFNTFKTLVFTN